MLHLRSILIIGIIFFSNLSTFAQTKYLNGYFPVNNYTSDDFNSPAQIWCGTQVEYGVFLFGNERQIIRFNGTDWSFVYKNPEDTIYTKDQIKEKTVRSFYISSDSICYVARDHSLGIVHYNTSGEHVYTPFYYDESLTKVWSIYEDKKNLIYFVSTSEILVYNPAKGTIKNIPSSRRISDGEIHTSIAVEDGFLLCMKYYKDSLISIYGEKDIVKFDFKSNSYISTKFTSEKKSYNFRNSFFIDGRYYLTDYYGQVYKYDKANNMLSFAYSLDKIDGEILKVNFVIYYDGLIWAATENHGIGIYDLDGTLLKVFGDKEGLQDLNVFNMFFDKDKNLWLNLDNGISSIEFSSPISLWNRMYELEGAVEAIDEVESRLLVASRSGVFYSKTIFNRKMLPNTETLNESAFDIKVFDTDFGRKILVVGYTGIYEITDFESPAERLMKDFYAWELFQSPFNKNEIYIGGEKFLGKLTLNDDEWDYQEIHSFSGDIIHFEFADSTLYFGVRGDGVYGFTQNEKLNKLHLHRSLDIKNSHYYFSKLNNTIYVGYNRGLLKIQEDTLVKAETGNFSFLNKQLNFHRLYTHPEKEELWAYIIDESNDESKKIIGYFKPDKNGQLNWVKVNGKSLESGIVLDIKFINGILYFGSTNGLIAFDRSKLDNVQKAWNVYINEVYVSGEKVLNIPEFSKNITPIKYGQSVRFSMNSASYFQGGEVMYRSRLVGLSNSWSKYENTDFKVFDQLPSGTYTFEVQGKNFYDIESEVYSYKFTVLPPWYLTWWAYLLYFVLLILIIVITTRVSIYRVKQKNKLLEETVKERTKEIASQNTVLEKQKSEIIEINEDLLSSIKYAKRIQNTILPSPEILSTYFNDFFVYYLPKDIVSGDFYWARKFDDKIIWSAVDCTGHGVPGAFVSIVGNNALVRSTNEFGLRQPAAILDKLRELVLEAFKAQGTNDVKDGMDLSLASLDPTKLELEYAGANNSLVIIREGKMIEVKADKQPIGDFEKTKPFTNHKIQLQKGDAIYLFSDGFVDQFGGTDEIMREKGGKKFKSKPFKALLLEIENLPMKEQKEILIDTFNTWRGDIDQIDDVCIFGVRV
jgi:serine phosphatase RsbU (regulator of sigma subunit)